MVTKVFEQLTDKDFMEIRDLALKELWELKGLTKTQISMAWTMAVLIVLKKKKLLED